MPQEKRYQVTVEISEKQYQNLLYIAREDQEPGEKIYLEEQIGKAIDDYIMENTP